ncbi:MAG: hypothetical protein LBL96_02740 [Clostridiales bacterium]|nr:hypothetical protein [Clostridiales bacterium]
MRDKIKDFWRIESAKMKDMSMKDKAGYIWEYYKFPIIGFIIGAIIIGSVVNGILNPPKDTFAQIVYYGGYFADDMLLKVETSIADAAMTDEEKLSDAVYSTVIYGATGDTQADMANSQKFMVMVAAAELDIIVFNKFELESLKNSEMLIDITTVMDEELQSRVGDLLIDNVALDISENLFFRSAGLNTEDMRVGVIVNTARLDNVKRVLNVILR